MTKLLQFLPPAGEVPLWASMTVLVKGGAPWECSMPNYYNLQFIIIPMPSSSYLPNESIPFDPYKLTDV